MQVLTTALVGRGPGAYGRTAIYESTSMQVLTTALVGGLQHKHMEARTRQSLENHV